LISKGVKLALAHLTGDYLLQSHWMANEKVGGLKPALVHGTIYGLCHLPVTRNPAKLLVIGGTHVVIDYFRLAKYVSWAKNQISPKSHRHPYNDKLVAGYPEGTPPWMATWLMIIVDNTMHLLINVATTKGDK
jgi:hypothetical protein